ncbi:MAG: bifunctional ADP-heptose synthase [Syntrophorhabdaceae bacterium]|nr:bifunctional ADP-heptose synthase [Syntrophorhabdaceae bacterium]
MKGTGLSTEERIIENFKDKKICVIGDIILDIYILGRPYRLSREAPVVVIKHEEERVYPGSAGNTINNLIALGAQVFPLGFIGRDEAGNRLIDYFSSHKNVDIKGLIRCDNETVTKTRILAGDTHTSKQQVIRIDKDRWKQVSEKERGLFEKILKEYIPHMDAFIVSDYGHGTVDQRTIKSMRGVAKEKIVVGDSRYNLKAFKGFTIITPNESEAYLLSSMEEGRPVEEVGEKILGFMDLTALLITRGNKGMSLFTGDGKIHHIPISGTDDVTDVTGAGDTVCAALALSLAAGADFLTASRIANYAAGVVVMKRGTATVTVDELRAAITSNHGVKRTKKHG